MLPVWFDSGFVITIFGMAGGCGSYMLIFFLSVTFLNFKIDIFNIKLENIHVLLQVVFKGLATSKKRSVLKKTLSIENRILY